MQPINDIWGYGTDISTFAGPGGTPGLDPQMQLIVGPRVLAESLARRLSTPLGSLVDDPSYGYDVRQLLGADLDAADLRLAAGAIQLQCELDERLRSVDVAVQLVGEELRIAITVEPITGEAFPMTLNVSSVTVALLLGAAA